MKAVKGNVVTIDYILKDEKNNIISSTEQDGEPMVYLHGYENIIPGLEEYLEGESVGFEGKATIAPEKAFGAYHPEAVVIAQKENFLEGVNMKVGEHVQAEGEHGPMLFKITEIDDEGIHLDPNHPLAGKTLVYSVEITDIREAREDEIEHGHPHVDGACGH